MSIKLAIAGASGKMGRMLIETALKSNNVELVVALEHANHSNLGQDAGAAYGVETGINLTSDLDQLANADCLIDFTRPEGSLLHLQACVKHHVQVVLGTTGCSGCQFNRCGLCPKHECWRECNLKAA
jgi:4-hydroxy-tetrahydrodipicolinate reductase